MLPDELLVGAEALVRNLLLGRAVCERFGARPAPVGYMPDSFGHPLQLPQILAGFGIDSFIFSRGLGDQLDDVGVVFRWRSPDGSEVRAFQQLTSYSNFNVRDADAGRSARTRSSTSSAPALTRAGVDAVLLCDGDDHRRIRRDLPALCAELERRRPGSSFTIARYEDYVAAVEPRRRAAGVHGRAARQPAPERAARRQLGPALPQARQRARRTAAARRRDPDRAGCAAHGRAFPTSDFRLAWRQLLKCHPHDSICGCSCDEVHRDMLVRYEQLDRTISALQQRALHGLAGATRQARLASSTSSPTAGAASSRSRAANRR